MSSKWADIKIVSGGQTGVDQAALAAARAAGFPTGGWMPYGWMTHEGIREDFRDLYGMKECQEPGYPPRTELNVTDSDGTLRIAKSFSTAGERCTLTAIHRHDKPHFDIPWKPKNNYMIGAASVVEWLIQHNIKVLNVAGNCEKNAPGIYSAAYEFLKSVFIIWQAQIENPELQQTRQTA